MEHCATLKQMLKNLLPNHIKTTATNGHKNAH